MPTRLKGRRHFQRLRAELLPLIEVLSCYLQVGLELSYAWNECVREMESGLSLEWRFVLKGAGLRETLELLSSTANPLPETRAWFTTLNELHGRGASLGSCIQSFARYLRANQERELTRHARELPTKLNLILLLFFLPPALLLTLVPLLRAISAKMLN